MSNTIDFDVNFEIDDKVQDRFWNKWIISWYFIGRRGLLYEIENSEKSWFEYPEYVKEVDTIWIKM
jgi:hypothetical protein